MIGRESKKIYYGENVHKELTNLRMYGSKGLCIRNDININIVLYVRFSKNMVYEKPHNVTGVIKHTGSEKTPKV